MVETKEQSSNAFCQAASTEEKEPRWAASTSYMQHSLISLGGTVKEILAQTSGTNGRAMNDGSKVADD